MEELLPCPFCGGEAEYRVGNRYVTQCHYIQCRKCKAQTVVIDEGTYLMFDGKSNLKFTTNTARQAVFESWNHRTQSEQPDVVHGRWVHIKEDGMTVAGKCSSCGYTIFNDSDETNYCPSCGAKMDGGEKGCG